MNCNVIFLWQIVDDLLVCIHASVPLIDCDERFYLVCYVFNFFCIFDDPSEVMVSLQPRYRADGTFAFVVSGNDVTITITTTLAAASASAAASNHH